MDRDSKHREAFADVTLVICKDMMKRRREAVLNTEFCNLQHISFFDSPSQRNLCNKLTAIYILHHFGEIRMHTPGLHWIFDQA